MDVHTGAVLQAAPEALSKQVMGELGVSTLLEQVKVHVSPTPASAHESVLPSIDGIAGHLSDVQAEITQPVDLHKMDPPVKPGLHSCGQMPSVGVFSCNLVAACTVSMLLDAHPDNASSLPNKKKQKPTTPRQVFTKPVPPMTA